MSDVKSAVSGGDSVAIFIYVYCPHRKIHVKLTSVWEPRAAQRDPRRLDPKNVACNCVLGKNTRWKCFKLRNNHLNNSWQACLVKNLCTFLVWQISVFVSRFALTEKYKYGVNSH